MSTINQLSAIDTASNGDLLAVYDTSNGDARKMSFSTLLTWIKNNFVDPTPSTTYATPADGFSITMTQDGTSAWLLLNPTTAIATGTIVLPAGGTAGVAVDGQEITITTTKQIAALTININGATAIYGEPTVVGAENGFKIRYNAQTTSWYKVA